MTLQVVIPSAISWFLTRRHVSMGFALVDAVVGECIGTTKGIGLLVARSQNTFNAAGIYAGLVILALVAEGLPTFAERRIFR